MENCQDLFHSIDIFCLSVLRQVGQYKDITSLPEAVGKPLNVDGNEN